MNLMQLAGSATDLLKKIIEIPSYSFEEEAVSIYLYNYLIGRGAISEEDYLNIESQCRYKTNSSNGSCSNNATKDNNRKLVIERIKNNIILYSLPFSAEKETLMLCSHMDTVNANEGYTVDPFKATEIDGRIIGLGSNDDGASLVSQIEVMFELIKSENHLNLIQVISAEEERSGSNGMNYVITYLKEKQVYSNEIGNNNNSYKTVSAYPNYAIMGEPTSMEAAIAERGLLVLDGVATGVSGHAARNEGVNALYIALEDITTLKNYNFSKKSPLMGDVKLTVTQLNCGTVHNVVPCEAKFVVDIRPTEQYNNKEIWELLQKEVKSELKPRNLKNQTSATPIESILFKAIERCGINSYVSPTTSDWMRITIPAIKMGPGNSSRSHRADEYVTKEEIAGGIEGYIKFIGELK